MHTNSKSDSYAAAGVDITAGYKAVELMKAHIARTMSNSVASDIGGFGGLFELDLTGISKFNVKDYSKLIIESEEDGAVTVRDRDTMEQVRVKIEELDAYFADKFTF